MADSALLGVASAAARARSPLPPIPAPPNAPNQDNTTDTQPPEYTGICGCCQWFLSRPICTKKKFVFMGWIVCGLMSLIFGWVYLENEHESINIGYILCCSLAILMSIYATFNFRDVLRLREQVNKLVDSTKQLADKRDRIRTEVGRLGKAHRKLEEVEGKLEDSNKALRKNFTKFKDWDSKINSQIKDNSSQAKGIRKDFTSAIRQYQRLLIQNEKAILDKAYRQVENKDGKKGLSKDEFEDLLLSLPARYRLKFDKMDKTFEDFAGSDDNIDHEEFAEFMNAMAEEEATCGLDLEQYGIVDKNKQMDDDEKGRRQ
eukprot:451347_1